MTLRVELVHTNLKDHVHCQYFLALMDHYASDPMGGGKGLSLEAKSWLVPRLQQRTDFVSLLALAGEQAIGLVNAFEGFSTFAARPLLNIHDIVVRAGFRGQGVGQRLLEGIEMAAKQRGCCKLTLEVLSNNRAALQSYGRYGFRPYELDPAAGQALFLEKKIPD